MNRRKFILGSVATASCVAVLRGSAGSSDGASLEVHVTYSGSGTVDESHKLYVAVWDTPDFVKEGGASLKPVGAARIMSKSGAATFDNLQKTPVYISMAFDASGKWTDPTSDPPSGTSLGVYGKEPGVPAPIDLQPGKTTKVFAELDDSFQKP
jgi:hypothetical protein